MTTTILKHPELTSVKTSYVSQLAAKNAEIEKAYADRNINVRQFKEIISNIVIGTNDKDIDNKSLATKRFLMSVQKAFTKDSLLSLVWNARLAGDNLSVLK